MVRERDKLIEHVARRLCRIDLSKYYPAGKETPVNVISLFWGEYKQEAVAAIDAIIEYDELRKAS